MFSFYTKKDKDITYETKGDEICIENTIIKAKITRTISKILRFGRVSKVELKSIKLDLTLLKLLSVGIRYSKVNKIYFYGCKFSHKTLINLKNMFSQVEQLELREFCLNNKKEWEAVLVALSDFSSLKDGFKRSIKILPNLKDCELTLEEEKKFIQMRLGDVEKNYKKIKTFRTIKYIHSDFIPDFKFLRNIFSDTFEHLYMFYPKGSWVGKAFDIFRLDT